uniref:Ion_trans domain-containing protein n=1 Tax=Panagrellus redivivus TaxID=6233 RepID=A0A7E4UYK1_PANRE
MAEGEADIDPDGPDLNQLQMEQLAKSVAIMDAADQELLTTLYHDRKRYLDMLVQIRRLYYVRMASITLTCFGLLLVISGLLWFTVDDANHLKYLQQCTWSDWEDDLERQVSFREICGAIQYGPYICDMKCNVDQKHVYTRVAPVSWELDSYLTCTDKFADTVYVKASVK